MKKDTDIKEMLEKQAEMLSERSKSANPKDLYLLSIGICKIAETIRCFQSPLKPND